LPPEESGHHPIKIKVKLPGPYKNPQKRFCGSKCLFCCDIFIEF